MTALCGGGISGPKPGVAETIIFTTASVASLLNNKGGSWATLAAPLLGVLAYESEQLCEVDPPSDPGLTSADYLALLQLSDWTAVQTAIGKLADLVKIGIWYQMCECKTVGTPAVDPYLFVPPSGVGNPVPGDLAPCYSFSGVLTTAWNDSAIATFPRACLTTAPFPQVTPSTWTCANIAEGTATLVARQTAWTLLRWKTEVLTPYTGQDVRVRCYVTGVPNLGNCASAAIAGGASDLWLPGHGGGESDRNGDSDISWAWGSWMGLYAFHHNVDVPVQVRWTMDAYCGVPGSTPSPCVADPATVALLQQILALLQLVQRQHVPFAYVPGLEYPGLTAAGEVTFSDPIVRVKVELTTLPGHYGMAEGSPDAIFDVGYITLGTADGFERPQRIVTSPFLLSVPGDVTKIGYSLSPGVVAKITTYSREP